VLIKPQQPRARSQPRTTLIIDLQTSALHSACMPPQHLVHAKRGVFSYIAKCDVKRQKPPIMGALFLLLPTKSHHSATNFFSDGDVFRHGPVFHGSCSHRTGKTACFAIGMHCGGRAIWVTCAYSCVHSVWCSHAGWPGPVVGDIGELHRRLSERSAGRKFATRRSCGRKFASFRVMCAQCPRSWIQAVHDWWRAG